MSGFWRWMTTACAMALAASAWAYPSFYGDTGLALTPTAETTRPADFYFGWMSTYTDVTGEQVHLTPYRFNMGTGASSEFAAFISKSEGDAAVDYLGGAIKVQVSNEGSSKLLPSVAAGIRYTGPREGGTGQVLEAYGVVTKTLITRAGARPNDPGTKIQAHGGIAYRIFTEGYTPMGGAPLADDVTFVVPFAGVSFSGNDGSQIGFDFVPEQSDEHGTFTKRTLSAVARLPIADSLILELGATRPYGEGESQTSYIGATYYFDALKPR
jgi:hypothetical protein